MMRCWSMAITINTKSIIIFDLDDTLHKEKAYLKSAFREISDKLRAEVGKDVFANMMQLYHAGEEVFGTIIEEYNIQESSKSDLLSIYREHQPNFKLEPDVADKLSEIKKQKIPTGLITDGRSLTQRNKLKGLGLTDYFDEILISEEFGSEKPNPKNFEYMQNKLKGENYIYIGDNIQKDFIAPNRLGWKTICLLGNGDNIHPQNFEDIDKKVKEPTFVINDFSEIRIIKS